MDRIRIRGGARLKGEIPISGAKNAALKLMAACLLTDETLTLSNVPALADVAFMAELLPELRRRGRAGRRATRLGEGGRLDAVGRQPHQHHRRIRHRAQDARELSGSGPAAGPPWPGQGLAARRLRHRRPAGRFPHQGLRGAWAPRSIWPMAMSSPARPAGLSGATYRAALRLGRRHREPDDRRGAGQGPHGARRTPRASRRRRISAIA